MGDAGQNGSTADTFCCESPGVASDADDADEVDVVVDVEVDVVVKIGCGS